MFHSQPGISNMTYVICHAAQFLSPNRGGPVGNRDLTVHQTRKDGSNDMYTTKLYHKAREGNIDHTRVTAAESRSLPASEGPPAQQKRTKTHDNTRAEKQ